MKIRATPDMDTRDCEFVNKVIDELVLSLERCLDSQECNGHIGVESEREAAAALARAKGEV